MSDSKLAIWKVLIVCDCLEVFVQDFQDLFFFTYFCVFVCVYVCVCVTQWNPPYHKIIVPFQFILKKVGVYMQTNRYISL